MSDEFWQNKVKAFFHDPPDKALLLFHVSYAEKRDLILGALGLNYNGNIEQACQASSALHGFYIPKDLGMDNPQQCDSHICFKGENKPVFIHPISGEKLNLLIDYINKNGYEKAVSEFGFDPETVKNYLDANDWRKTYLSLWRLIPEVYPLGYILPADARLPDHSIYDQLDVASAISSGKEGLALLSARIIGTQEFISNSRKLSDLWASSYIYSLLIFEAIKVISEELGPDSIIYPQIRENPMFDLYLKNEFGVNVKIDVDKLKIASLPNVLLSFVPQEKGEEYREKIASSLENKWRELSLDVKKYLQDLNIKINENIWNRQIDRFLMYTVEYFPFINIQAFETLKEALPKDIAEKQNRWIGWAENLSAKDVGHFYLTTYGIISTIITQKARLWDPWQEEPETGKKCLMCGIRNALIERDKNGAYHYWGKNGWEEVKGSGRENYLKEGERLCAVCLVKRLYGEEIFQKEFNAQAPEFASTCEIAGRYFIENIENSEEYKKIKSVDSQFIFKDEWDLEENEEAIKRLGGKDGPIYRKLNEWWSDPELKRSLKRYYSVLMIDGDQMGKTLLGGRVKNLGDLLHPKFRESIIKWERGQDFLNTTRILNPSLHIAISRAMKDFSIHKVPEIIEKHHGFLVYSGGDDVLALFPTDQALKAAKELQDYFQEDFYDIEANGTRRKAMGLGKGSHMSAGIVFAHYKYPLYDVLERVRQTEKDAKNRYGRNAFALTFIKHSGELMTAGGKWHFVDDLLEVVDVLVKEKISGGFIYEFMNILEFLDGEMLKSDVKRLLMRKKTDKASEQDISEVHRKLCALIDKYVNQGIELKNLGKALKILYDAYRGEEQ